MAMTYEEKIEHATKKAPGSDRWQAFVRHLGTLQTGSQRLAELKNWPLDGVTNCIRVHTYLLSIREMWYFYPSLRDYDMYVIRRGTSYMQKDESFSTGKRNQ